MNIRLFRFIGIVSLLLLATPDVGAAGWAGHRVGRRPTQSSPTLQAFSPDAAGTTERVSLADDGTQANNRSFTPSISADGRYVAFASDASNLVGGDTNGCTDVFVRDRLRGKIERISVASDDTQANDHSYSPSISADGRYVAFESRASNLVDGDTNGRRDVFVRDRYGSTVRVSLASDDTQANDHSYSPSISADGRYIAFESDASNLVGGDGNGVYDIFVRDRVGGTTERVSLASDETQANDHSYRPSISADGRYVAFESDASNLVISDTNGVGDIFVRDCIRGTTARVSLASDGMQANDDSLGASISADGKYVAFFSSASNLVGGDTNGYREVFVHIRVGRTTERVSLASDETQANGGSYFPSISTHGRYVAFDSNASNLVSGYMYNRKNVYVRDRLSGRTERVSLASDGTLANGEAHSPSISGDGRYVAFASEASNLVFKDTNGAADVFVRVRLAGDLYLPLILMR